MVAHGVFWEQGTEEKLGSFGRKRSFQQASLLDDTSAQRSVSF